MELESEQERFVEVPFSGEDPRRRLTVRLSAPAVAGLHRVDHIVGNVEDRQMDRWVAWYNRILDFDRFVSYDDKDISTDRSCRPGWQLQFGS